MTGTSQRQLVFEVERVQTVRRRVATHAGFCNECRGHVDFVDLCDLARMFQVSIAEAVLQLRQRHVHMQHRAGDVIVLCTESLLARTDTDSPVLCKSLPPAFSPSNLTISSE